MVWWRREAGAEGRAEGQGGAAGVGQGSTAGVAQTGQPRGHGVAVCFRALPGAHLGSHHPQGQGWGVYLIACLPPPIVRAGDTQQGVRSLGRAGVAACPGLGPPPPPIPRRPPGLGGKPEDLARLAEPRRRRPVSVSSRRKPTPSTLKAGELRTHVSRCQVCMRRT